MTEEQIRALLKDIQNKIALQGSIVDARLLQKEQELLRLLAQ